MATPPYPQPFQENMTPETGNSPIVASKSDPVLSAHTPLANHTSTPAMPIPASSPVEETSPNSLSEKVFSISSKSLASLKDAAEGGEASDDETPKPKGATTAGMGDHTPAQQEVEHLASAESPFSEENERSLTLTHSVTCQLGLRSQIAPILKKEPNDLHIYLSKVVEQELKKPKFLHNSSHGHTWKHTLTLKVDKRCHITVQLFLQPGVTDDDSEKKAVFFVTTAVKKCTLKRLNDNEMDCWVLLQTEVHNSRAGRSIGYGELCPRPVDSQQGTVNFHHNLVSCEEIENCNCGFANVVIKVAFITCQRSQPPLVVHEDKKLDFVMIDKPSEATVDEGT